MALLWSAVALQFGLIAASLGLTLAARSGASTAGDPAGAVVAFGIVTLAFPTVGAAILIRRPAQLVGRLLCVVALGWAFANAASAYAEYARDAPQGTVPGLEWALWLSGNSWTIVASQGVLLLLLLVYPTGSLPSPLWRPIRPSVAAWTAATMLVLAFGGGPLDDRFGLGITNPAAAPEPIGLALRALAGPLQLGFMALLALVATSLVVRFRRSRGIEREQLKWMAAAATVALLGVALSLLLLSPEGAAAEGPGTWLPAVIQIGILSPALLPVAIGIAILRYRLYDIDLLINRTLVYGSLSATLLGTYLLSVLGLSALLRPLTGSSDLAVAGSTLAVVALFGPLRARLQRFVDRRFYRSRYDAARTLDAFGLRLRDEVDLDSVRADLLDVVGEALRPAHASVWLRDRGGR